MLLRQKNRNYRCKISPRAITVRGLHACLDCWNLFESIIEVSRIKVGKKQSITTLITEVALLLSKFLRNELKTWKPRIFNMWSATHYTFISSGVDVVLQNVVSLAEQDGENAHSDANLTGNRAEHRVEKRNRQNHVVLHVGCSLCSQLRNSMVSDDLLPDQKKKRSLRETRKTGGANPEQTEKNKCGKAAVRLFANKESQKRVCMDYRNTPDHSCLLRFLFSEE